VAPALAGGLLATAVVGLGGACNTGIFAKPDNAAAVVCSCTCGVQGPVDAGDACYAACKAPFDSAQEVARKKGCSPTFEAYSQCLEDEGICAEQSFNASACGGELDALIRCESSIGGAGGGPT
jgi:hypothetical protein